MKNSLPEFDVLVEMARTDPGGLESLRQRLTDSVIDAQTDEIKQQRLKGLMFQIDMERAKAPTPLAACIRISEMMCQSLADLHRSMITPMEEDGEAPTQSADVLPFGVHIEDITVS